MAARELFRSNAVSALIATFLTLLVTKFLAKTARLRYSTSTERVATAAEDPVFGSVRVTLANNPVRNLYMVSIEIENESSRDFENACFTIYTATDTFLLNEQTWVVDSPDIVKWSPEFYAQLAVPPDEHPSPAQMSIYNHRREYKVPVLNRGQRLKLNYLCTRNDDIQPIVFVSTQIKGARLQRQAPTNVLFGVPVPLATIRGLIISVVTFVICVSSIQRVWVASGISLLVGLMTNFLGAMEYKAERFIWKLIAG